MGNYFQGKDYYAELELTIYASSEDIKWSFRRLAHQYHPDKGTTDSNAAEKFQRILEAYQVLSDPAKRVAYHREISVALPSEDPAVQWETFILQLKSLNEWVQQVDPFRYDVSGYSEYVAHLCSRAIRYNLQLSPSPSDINKMVALFIPCMHLVDKRKQALIARELKSIPGISPKQEAAMDAACALPGYSAGWPIKQLLIALVITLLIFAGFMAFFKR